MEKKIAIEFTAEQLQWVNTILQTAQNQYRNNDQSLTDIIQGIRSEVFHQTQEQLKVPIKKRDIVSYQGGHYRVTSVRGGKANLGAIFGKGIYHKGVSVHDMFENEKEWYKKWSQSETYMCM
jgi:beta-galactosidase/beta-glucuronidase